MKENDPVAAYFDKLPETHQRQFEEHASGANFNFQQRLTLVCELGGASSGRLLDCAAVTGEITCALLKSGRFNRVTVVDVSSEMLQAANELLSSQIKNAELEFVWSDVFKFKPSDSHFDLILCLGWSRVTISHRAHLCAGTHDHTQPDFPLLRPPIVIGSDAWICADAFVGPGVTVGEGAIVGARAVAMKDVKARRIVVGNPARESKKRETSQ